MLLGVRRRRVYPMPEQARRLIPLGASEAAGSPTSLLSPRKNVGRSTAVWRWNMSYTARAHVCASPVNAFP
jgi:hypothetical protein